MSYLGVMHSFRLGTEAATREGLDNSVAGGYFKALGQCMAGRTAMATMRITWAIP